MIWYINSGYQLIGPLYKLGGFHWMLSCWPSNVKEAWFDCQRTVKILFWKKKFFEGWGNDCYYWFCWKLFINLQDFHWSNDQVILHPFVCYYRRGTELVHINLVVISDCLKHDTVAVHLFQRNLVKMLKNKINFDIKKLIYFSDGAASHYKNYKNVVNLCNAKADFGIDAGWHIFTTSLGKGPSDGLSGTV